MENDMKEKIIGFVFVELYARGTNVNTKIGKNCTPLHSAATMGYLYTVRSLVERGADVNARDEEGWTPLHSAAAWGYLDIVYFLLDRGAELNAKDENGLTPLHYAAAFNRCDVVRLLVERGAHVNAEGEGYTPFLLATLFGYPDIVRLLIETGVDVNARDANGWTPLHWSVMLSHSEIISLLLRSGSDLTICDKEGKTPADLAREKGDEEFVRLIEGHVKDKKDGKKPIGPPFRQHTSATLIESVETSTFTVGKVNWSILRVVLSQPAILQIEGEVEWLNRGEVEGVVEVPVKPRKTGKLPLAITAKSGNKEERKIIWVDVTVARSAVADDRRLKCCAPKEPEARYCWYRGAKLD